MEKQGFDKLKAIQKEIQENVSLDQIENVLMDNVIEFEHEDKNGKITKYRVIKPTAKQKAEIYQSRMKKFTELIQKKEYMLEENLKEQYKKRGIDIDELDKQIQDLEKEKHDFNLKLGEALEKKLPDSHLETLRNEIEKRTNKQTEISMRKTSLLEMSIEQQSVLHTYNYLSFLIAEKYIEFESGKTDMDKWVKVWNKWEDYEKEKDDKLMYIIAFNAMFIAKDELNL